MNPGTRWRSGVFYLGYHEHMAPPIRILSLLVLIAALASGHAAVMTAAFTVLCGTWVLLLAQPAPFDWHGLLRMLRRVRWLLLAMLILYGGFTGGEPLWPALGPVPTLPGLLQGAQRIAALVAIVTAVHLLLSSTARPDLLAGLLWFGAPLRRFGIDDRPFATRLVLALEAVPQVQDLARAAAGDSQGKVSSNMQIKGRLAQLVEAGSRLLNAALEQAEKMPATIQLPEPPLVPAWQWLIPVTLLLLFTGLALPA